MRIKGIDNGYLETKDDEGRFFNSSITKDETDVLNKNTIIINEVTYSVGIGERTTDFEKANSEITTACTLLNLALTGSDDYFLVGGLPLSQYKDQKDDLRNALMSLSKNEVYYKRKRFDFSIKDVSIFPQGVAAIFSLANLNNGQFLLIDIGGLTIDVVLIEIVNGSFMIVKYDTWYMGVQKIYPTIIDVVNRKYKLNEKPEYTESIFKFGLTVDGERQDLSFLEPVKHEFLKETIQNLKLNYPCRTTPIFVSGGGAMVYKEIFNKEFKNSTIIDNPQFANAIGYYKVGLTKYKKYINIPLSNNIR